MKSTVLIVDDIPSNIHVLREILKDTYQIKAATSGARALEILFKDSTIDIVLLDVMMPEMDGYEVCRRMRSDSRTEFVPVIFVTAMGEVKDEVKGFQVGGNDYITKPVQPILVKERVKNHIALSKQRAHLEALVEERTKSIEQTKEDLIKRLGIAGDFKDNETGKHVDRVARYCEILGRAIGMDAHSLEYLKLTAPMHDIGKIGIPDCIIGKAGPLTSEERLVINTHPLIGAQIIGEHNDPLLSMAYDIALTHHEKWDGTGYPSGLKGEEIPLTGRIVCMADIFDALMSRRPYKEPWPIESVIEYIQAESGKTFDPKLVEAFLQNATEIASVFFEEDEQAVESEDKKSNAKGDL